MRSVPVKPFIIIGRANTGKTLFILNFSEFMGYDNLTIKFKSYTDENKKSNSIKDFKKYMVSDLENTTKCLQFANIEIPVFKGRKTAEFIDTTGVSSSIHMDQDVREGMIQTLMLLKEDCIIFHMLDAPSIVKDEKIDEIDMEIYRYGSKKGSYLVLANKMDLLNEYIKSMKIICQTFSEARIIKISALYKTGFDEVKKYVSKLI